MFVWSGSVPAVHAGGWKLLAAKGGSGVGGGGLTKGGRTAHHLGLQAARGWGAAEAAFAHVVVHRRNLQNKK